MSGFRCRVCFLNYDDDNQKADSVLFMGILTHMCKQCKRTGNTKRNTICCEFCDEKRDDLKEYVEDDLKVLLCDRCRKEAKEQRNDPRYL